MRFCATELPKTARIIPANGQAHVTSMVQVEPHRPLPPRRNHGPVDGCEGASGELPAPSLRCKSHWRSFHFDANGNMGNSGRRERIDGLLTPTNARRCRLRPSLPRCAVLDFPTAFARSVRYNGGSRSMRTRFPSSLPEWIRDELPWP
jgi:hypothetical protein